MSVDVATLARLERQWGTAVELTRGERNMLGNLVGIDAAAVVSLGDSRFQAIMRDGSEQFLDLKSPLR